MKVNATVSVICTYIIQQEVEVELEVPDDASEQDINIAIETKATEEAVELSVENRNNQYTPEKVEIEEVYCVEFDIETINTLQRK